MPAHTVGALTLTLITLASASGVGAQLLEAGDRIRVTAPALQLESRPGTLVLMDGGNVVVDGTERWTIPLDAISLLEVSQGRRGHGGKGALIGAAIGLAVGAVVFSRAEGGGHCSGSEEGAGMCLAGLGAMVGVGTLGGLVVGLAIQTERWSPVSLPSPQARGWHSTGRGGRDRRP